MKCKIAFLTLTVLFVIILSGTVSAADHDNNAALQDQAVQNQSPVDVSALPDPVNTRTHYNSTDIQPVIDHADTLSGDTISIKGGFTYGPVILNKSLTLVWDGTGTKPIIPYLYINNNGSGSIIDGLDIEYDSSLNPVAGITLDNTNNIVIKNSAINGFKMGLYQLNSTNITIQGNNIINNSISGIELINSTATINSFNNITDNDGFGIYSQDSTVYIESNTIGGKTVDTPNGLSGIFIGYTNSSNNVNTIKGNVISYNGFNSYSYLDSNGIILLNARGNNIIQNNTINNNIGEGILLYNSTAAITSNYVYNNTEDGIGLYDSSTAAITGNWIYNNTWAGIYSENSAVDIKNNTIGNNKDYQILLDKSTSTGVISNNIYGDFGLFFNANDQLVQFNRIVTAYSSIDNEGTGTVNATLNWFGSNTDPSAKMMGNNINFDSWLVLTITAQPGGIWINGVSKVVTDLKHDNMGNIHNEGYVPDGILVNFSDITLGSLNSLSSSTLNGIVTATFTARAITGLTNVNATVDNQNVSTNISIAFPPTVNITPDQGNFYAPVNVNLSVNREYSPYKIFFTIDGSTPTTGSAQYTKPIDFNTTHTLKYFVQDKFGNISQIYTKQYNIYKLITYKYPVREPVKKWYKSKGKWKYKYATVKVKKWYKKYYKYKGKWKSKWKWKWVTVIKYITVYKTGQRWVLT